MKKEIEKEAQVIAQNQGVLEVLQFLSQHCSPQAREYNKIVLLHARYNRIQREKSLHSEEQYNVIMGRITNELFNLIGLTYQPPEKKKNPALNFVLSEATLSKANVIRDLLSLLAKKTDDPQVILLIGRFNSLIKRSKSFAVDEAEFNLGLNRIEAGIRQIDS